jgi:hypothetical protein
MVAAKMADASTDTVTRVTLDAMRKFPPEKVKIMTYDNSYKENNCTKQIKILQQKY